MVRFFDGLGELSVIAAAMIVFANIGFLLLKPFVVRLHTAPERASELRGSDIMLIVVPALLLAAGIGGYKVAEWLLR